MHQEQVAPHHQNPFCEATAKNNKRPVHMAGSIMTSRMRGDWLLLRASQKAFGNCLLSPLHTALHFTCHCSRSSNRSTICAADKGITSHLLKHARHSIHPTCHNNNAPSAAHMCTSPARCTHPQSPTSAAVQPAATLHQATC